MSLHFNFFRPTPYNPETKEQLWISSINDSHDSFCGCCKPITHMLSLLFPKDHKDRYISIDQILKREIKDSQCLFGGAGEKDGGEAKEDPGTEEDIQQKEKEEEFENIDVEDLIAATEDATKR